MVLYSFITYYFTPLLLTTLLLYSFITYYFITLLLYSLFFILYSALLLLFLKNVKCSLNVQAPRRGIPVSIALLRAARAFQDFSHWPSAPQRLILFQ